MALQKKDFIEIEFTGRVKDGGVFDSNIKADLEDPKAKKEAKPFVFAIDEGMFLKGIDEFLIGKEIGKYKIELTPDKAFGKRDPKLIQMMPIKVFAAQQVNPVPGAMFNFDGRLAKVLTVSGGRVMVDFNNPLAGKDVEYDLKVLRKIEDVKEKINALNDFLFRKEFKFEIKDTLKGTSKKLILEIPEEMVKFVEMFKDKYKELFELELEIKGVKKEVKEEKKVEEKVEEKKEEKVDEEKKEEKETESAPLGVPQSTE